MGFIAAALGAALNGLAQGYPAKPIRMLVGFPVGVSSDTAARLVSQKLSDFSYSTITAVLPMLDSGRLRPLAITSLKRSPLMPRTPTVDESGLRGYECVGWFGVVAPAGAPREAIDRLHALIVKAGPELAPQMSKQGLDIKTNTPEQFAVIDPQRNRAEHQTDPRGRHKSRINCFKSNT